MIELQKEHFEAWVESQPNEREFSFHSNEHCAIASFIRETTRFKQASCGGNYWRTDITDLEKNKFDQWFNMFCTGVALRDKFSILDIKGIIADINSKLTNYTRHESNLTRV